MKKLGIFFLCYLFLLSGCQADNRNDTSIFQLELHLSKDYDDKDPFVDERLFYVEKDMEQVQLNFQIKMKGSSGLLEIADNDSEEVFWQENWNTQLDSKKECILNLKKDIEYVIRFKGTGIQHADITMSSKHQLKERSKPLRNQ